MKGIYLIILLSAVSFLKINAQPIIGKVLDGQNQPIEFANVALYSLLDSTLVTGTVTNQQGEFSLTPNGTKESFLKISFIGYETQIVPAVSSQTVVLKEDSKMLDEVMVKGNLPRIEIKNDALVTTIQNTVLSKVGTGNDVLKRLPSLTGDDGVFSVFGKGEAKIYINNREMRDVSELDNLNSADIRNVEIVNNPGARYDASVKAVIRINTVPKAGDGFGFDVRSSYYQSQNVDLTEQLNVNYRKNGWDAFGTFSYTHDEWIQNSEIWQKTYVDTLWTQDNTLSLNGRDNNYLGIAGINYEISPKQYVGTKYTLSVSPNNTAFSEMISTVHADGVFYDKWSSIEDKSTKNKPAHRLSSYYNGTFGNLNVDFNADYYTSKNVSTSTVTEKSQEYDDRQVNSESNDDNRLLASKLVFTHPLAGGELSVGSEYNNTHRNDKYTNIQNIVPSSKTTTQEQNIALFAEYFRSISIGQFGAGLRYENVNSEYFENEVLNKGQSRHYSQWFPNLFFGTKIKNVGLQLSYTAKTKRPTYRQLSSNVFYGNRLLLQTGNPYLKPTTIHDVTLVGAWRFIQLMMSYKDERNAVIYWTEQDKENPAVSILAYKNLERMPSMTVFASLSPTIGIWSPQLSAGFIKQWVTIMSSGKPVKLNKPLPIISLNNSLQLPKGFIFTLDAQYMGEGDTQNIHLIKNNVEVNASITKSFFNDRLNLSLKGHDVFLQSRDGNLLYNAQMELYQMNRYDSRQLELSVRYKFNTARSKYKGTGSGQSEINRM